MPDLILNISLQKTYTEEELNAKLTKRVQKAARRQAKQEELKRLHRAQVIYIRLFDNHMRISHRHAEPQSWK